MAYAIVASKWLGDKKYIEAVLDSAADLAALGDGYAPDSRAIVAEGGAAYMTDASGHWQELGSPGGGGGSSVTVEPLTITQNGTTTAPSGKAYSPVTTNVPNSYGASDEGKVVNNGALVAQTAHADVTANATIDTTINNSVKVVVPSYVYQYVDYESFEDMGYVFDYLSIDAQTWQIKLKQQRGGAYELVCLPFSGSLPTTLNFISPIPVSLSGFAVTGYLSVVFERINDHYELMYIQFVSADGYHNVKSQLENEYQIITVTKYEATVEFYPD